MPGPALQQRLCATACRCSATEACSLQLCPVLAVVLVVCNAWQVEQILNLRTDLMEAAEKLRRSEAERQQLDTDITSLRQQVRSSSMHIKLTAV